MIAIIDFGLGNVQAFLNIYKGLHVPAYVARDLKDFAQATHLILPGVGHFDDAMVKFNDSGLRPEVERLVLYKRIPILGVCVGMQIMANTSSEGVQPGLGWIGGEVVAMQRSKESYGQLPIPHMGWNDVETENLQLFREIDGKDLRFYFLHSYAFKCADEKNCIASTEYASMFCSAINKDNIFGVQFHPEKSHTAGVTLLKNFAELGDC